MTSAGTSFNNLFKELEFDGQKFQKYFRLTRKQFTHVLYYVEGDIWENSAELFRKHLSLTSYSRFSLPNTQLFPPTSGHMEVLSYFNTLFLYVGALV